jgi:hypothetical protein
MKRIFLHVIILSFTFFIFCCMPYAPEPKNPPNDIAHVIMIEDFNDYELFSPPGGGWNVYCDTDYEYVENQDGQEKNSGVVVEDWLKEGDNYLTLMNDIYGDTGTLGASETGYSYAQIIFTADVPGRIKFDYYHVGLPTLEPNFDFVFWLNIDKSAIPNADITKANWIDSAATDTGFSTCSIKIDNPGTYKLTWEAIKNDVGYEDEIYIDNIRFEYD